MMKSITELKQDKIKVVFCDIDDTLTEKGKLIPESFSALWRLARKGIKVIPVTGRPAGWCELIARQWPVDGVIGENGGLYYRLKNNEMFRYYSVPNSTRVDNQKRLEKVRAEILATVPGSKIASDQFCRIMDLAVDFAEDVVPPLPLYAAEKIVEVFRKHGAQAKISSIHVNGWYGDYDKLSMCETYLQQELTMGFSENMSQLLFIGDSPNDEPMFHKFENSVAVANIRKFQEQLKHFPKFITQSEGGLGFAELCDHLVG